jgi:hypothetical protein
MNSAPNDKAKPNKRRRLVLFFVLSVLCMCFAYGYLLLLATTTTTWELAECSGLGKAVEAEHFIPTSVSKPSSPAFFCDLAVRYPFLQRFDDLKIYGVTDHDRQDAVIETLKRYRHQAHTKPLRVQFYEKENWQTWSNPATGVHGGRRGPEIPLRVVSLN